MEKEVKGIVKRNPVMLEYGCVFIVEQENAFYLIVSTDAQATKDNIFVKQGQEISIMGSCMETLDLKGVLVIREVDNEVPYSQEVEALQVDESMDDIPDDVIEEVETESKDMSEELPFEEGTWQLAYYNYLIEGSNNSGSGGYNGFDLHDFDGEGVPELVIMLNNGNAGVARFIEGQAEEVYIPTDYSYLDGEHLGYGERASQLINLWEEVDEEGRDITHYSMYDNFEYIEKVEVSSIVINNILTYIVHTNAGTQDISYEEGQSKIQSIRETYQKADFKEMNEETIIATLKAYH